MLREGEEMAQAFASLKSAGKVRYFSVSMQAWRALARGLLSGKPIADQAVTVSEIAALVEWTAKERGMP